MSIALCTLFFSLFALQSFAFAADEKPVIAMQLDLDFIYSQKDPSVLKNNLDKKIKLMKRNGYNTVFLQAFCDMDGDGNVHSVYFDTTFAPVEANVFNQALTQLKRAGFDVFAWMPTLSCQWLTKDPRQAVVSIKPDQMNWYNRATPFSRDVLNNLSGLFSDLAKNNDISGILFQDDLYLSDFEDFSVYAKAAYKARYNIELTEQLLRDDEDANKKWIALKTAALNDLTRRLMGVVNKHRPNAKSFRNIYAAVVYDANAQEWFAQSYLGSAAYYDGLVIMAYPYLEDGVKSSDQANKWLDSFFRDMASSSKELKRKTIIKLQTLNWDDSKQIPQEQLLRWISSAKRYGFESVAFYPYTELRVR